MRPREVPPAEKPLYWVARSRKELMALPSRVQCHVALALRLAQEGGRHESAKVLKGFGDARVLDAQRGHALDRPAAEDGRADRKGVAECAS